MRPGAVIRFAAALLLAGFASRPAAAQGVDFDQDTRERQGINYAKSNETPKPLEREEVVSLLNVVGATDDQRSGALDMFEGYEAKVAEARKKMGAWYMETFVPNGNWVNDAELWRKSQPTFEKYRKHIAKLRTNYLSDVRLLMTADQDAQWSKLEKRLARRDLMGETRGTVGLASVDLEAVVRSALKDAPLPPDTADALNGYQDALDRAAQQTESFKKDEAPPERGEMNQEEYARAFQARYYQNQIAKWKPLQDVNVATLRKVLPTLPEPIRDRVRFAFWNAGSAQSAMEWFGDTGAGPVDWRKVDALKDMSEQQRAEIDAIRADHDREWADRVQREGEESLRLQESDPEKAMPWARNAQTDWMKRWSEMAELGRKYRERVGRVLSEAQAERAGLKVSKEMEMPKFEQ